MTTMREILEAKGGDFHALLERLEAQTKTGVTLRVLPGGMDPTQRKIAPTMAAAKSAPPAVKQHADADKGRELRGIGVGIGDTEEHDGLRFHRYSSALRVTDLANAGKRGKSVPEFALYNLDYTFGDKAADELENALEAIAKAKTYAQALQIAKKVVEFVHADGSRYGSSLNIEERPLRGVDVDPPEGASGAKIEIDTPHFSLSVDARGFSVHDKDDRNNEPCIITPVRGAKQTAVKAFRSWVEANRDRLQSLTFDKLVSALHDAGVNYHYFCAMD